MGNIAESACLRVISYKFAYRVIVSESVVVKFENEGFEGFVEKFSRPHFAKGSSLIKVYDAVQIFAYFLILVCILFFLLPLYF